MKKISTELKSVIEENAFLQYGLHYGLLNLSQLARHLNAQISARVGKRVEDSAITMNLSRIQREMTGNKPILAKRINISHLVINSDLCVIVYPCTPEVHSAINKLYTKVQKGKGYITVTEGISEVAIITNQKYLSAAKELFGNKPIYLYTDVSSIGVKFAADDLNTIGLYYSVFQEIFFQKINIIEIASAGAELIVYIEVKDIKLAFDTLFHKFRPKSFSNLPW